MAWTIDATTGIMTHAGTVRDAFIPSVDRPTQGGIRVKCTSKAGHVRVVIPSDPDGRTGFEIGIMADGTAVDTDLTIRRVAFARPSTMLDNQPLTFAAGVEYTLVITFQDNIITAEAIATGYGVVTATWTNTTDPTYTEHRNWAVVSDINGAIVLGMETFDLRAVFSEVAEALLAVGAGDVWLCADGASIEKIGPRAFSNDSDVSIAELNGLGFGVDGVNAKIIDIVGRSVDNWGPAAGGNWTALTTGNLPGATLISGTTYTAGTTKAKIVCAHVGRIFLGGMEDQSTVLYATAIGDAQMLWVNEPVEGRAFVMGVGRAPGMADPVVSLTSVNESVLLVGSTRSMSVVVGDPISGVVDVRVIANDTGMSGLNAVATAMNGVNVAHSPDGGLMLVPPANAPVPITREVLTQTIQFPREGRADYRVSVVRDSIRHGLLIFLTTRDATVAATHFWYDERTGRYEAGTGGLFPEQYPLSVGPTCAVNWRGRVVMGGRDGYLYTFAEHSVSGNDQGGIAKTTRFPFLALNEDGVVGETVLNEFRPEMSDAAGSVTFKVYGAGTVESLYTAANRRLRRTFTVAPAGPFLSGPWSDPAIMVELSTTAAGAYWEIESVEADLDIAPFFRRGKWVPVAAPHGPCVPNPLPPSPPPPPPPGPGTGPGPVTPPVAPPPGPFTSEWVTNIETGFPNGGSNDIDVFDMGAATDPPIQPTNTPNNDSILVIDID